MVITALPSGRLPHTISPLLTTARCVQLGGFCSSYQPGSGLQTDVHFVARLWKYRLLMGSSPLDARGRVLEESIGRRNSWLGIVAHFPAWSRSSAKFGGFLLQFCELSVVGSNQEYRVGNMFAYNFPV